MKHLLIVVGILLMLTACSKQQPPPPQPTPSPKPSPSPEEPKARAAGTEAADQNAAYEHFPNISRIPIREAAAEFVRAELPTWTVKGISTEAYESNVFWADVDIESGKRRRMLSLIVKRFYPDDGDPYWKAFPLDKSHPSRLYDARDSEIKREFEDYKNEHP